jgi:hypothetical protein
VVRAERHQWRSISRTCHHKGVRESHRGWCVQHRQIGVAPTATEDMAAIADYDVAPITHRECAHQESSQREGNELDAFVECTRLLNFTRQQMIVLSVDHHTRDRLADLRQVGEMNTVERAQTNVGDQDAGTADVQLLARGREFGDSDAPIARRRDDGGELRHEYWIGIDDQRARRLLSCQGGRHILAELPPDVNSIPRVFAKRAVSTRP